MMFSVAIQWSFSQGCGGERVGEGVRAEGGRVVTSSPLLFPPPSHPPTPHTRWRGKTEVDTFTESGRQMRWMRFRGIRNATQRQRSIATGSARWSWWQASQRPSWWQPAGNETVGDVTGPPVARRWLPDWIQLHPGAPDAPDVLLMFDIKSTAVDDGSEWMTDAARRSRSRSNRSSSRWFQGQRHLAAASATSPLSSHQSVDYLFIWINPPHPTRPHPAPPFQWPWKRLSPIVAIVA